MQNFLLGSQPEGRQRTLAANLIDLEALPESTSGSPSCSWDKFGMEINFFSAISGQSAPNNSPNFSAASRLVCSAGWRIGLNVGLFGLPFSKSSGGDLRIWGEGGILTQPLLLSYHLFSNMRGTSMNIGDFNDLACCNSFNCSA